MRTMETPQQWPPGYLDEVAALLVNVPYPHMKPSQPRDVEYGLLTALIETEAWLDVGLNSDETKGDRRSRAADVGRALNLRGAAVCARGDSGDRLRAAMLAAVEKASITDRDLVRDCLDGLRAELTERKAAADAFHDLLDAVRDPASSHLTVAARLAVFTDALEITDRPSAEVCRVLGGILDDQAIEVSLARHSLDGTPTVHFDKPDDFAGLTEQARLELSRRYLLRPAREGHHVIWVAYDDARISVDDSWREQVGLIEFFDGPTLLSMLASPESVPADQPLPRELLVPGEIAGRRDVDVWPSAQEHQHWVAARIELPIGAFSNPIQVGRAQADAVVDLAMFEDEKSTWEPLAGVLHLVDDVHHSSEQFHTPNELQRRIKVEKDTTAAEFHDIAESVASHLPITNPLLQRLLRDIGALNASSRSIGLDLLTRETSVVEAVTRLNERPSATWPDFLETNLSDFEARRQVIDEIYAAVEQVLNSLHFPEDPELHVSAIREFLPDGRTLFKRKAALDLVPDLAPSLPEHHTPSRRLREVARRLQNVEHLKDWVDELAADCRIKVDRAERLRNALTHGGAAPTEVAATVRLLINRYARIAAGTALRAVVAGDPPKKAFDTYRKANRRWRQRILDASDVCEAIFDPPTDQPDRSSDEQ